MVSITAICNHVREMLIFKPEKEVISGVNRDMQKSQLSDLGQHVMSRSCGSDVATNPEAEALQVDVS